MKQALVSMAELEISAFDLIEANRAWFCQRLRPLWRKVRRSLQTSSETPREVCDTGLPLTGHCLPMYYSETELREFKIFYVMGIEARNQPLGV